MSAPATRRGLLGALVLLALGGLLLHYRIHPSLVVDPGHPDGLLFRRDYLPATLVSLVDLVVVTALFLSRRTAAPAHLVNGMLVIYGTVLMGHHSIAALTARGAVPADWILRSTLPDVALAWADFLVGKALFDSWMREA